MNAGVGDLLYLGGPLDGKRVRMPGVPPKFLLSPLYAVQDTFRTEMCKAAYITMPWKAGLWIAAYFFEEVLHVYRVHI